MRITDISIRVIMKDIMMKLNLNGEIGFKPFGSETCKVILIFPWYWPYVQERNLIGNEITDWDYSENRRDLS